MSGKISLLGLLFGITLLPTPLFAQSSSSNQTCLEWNSFLAPVFNIQENSDISGSGVTLQTTVYDLNGVAQSTGQYPISPGGQEDIIVSDLSGYTPNSYGLTCTEIVSGGTYDAASRMVIYKLAPGTTWLDGNYQFAYAMDPAPIRGTQSVFYNTYQPSLAARDAGNFVANWIQLSNPVPSSGSAVRYGGVLKFYAQDGSVLKSSRVSVPAGGRVDIAGHDVGTSRVGIVQWVPDDNSVPFQLRNVRYMYDNATLAPSFDTAFQLSGETGVSGMVSVPVDTTDGTGVLEIGNLSNSSATSVTVNLYSRFGVLRQAYSQTVAPHSVWHIIADGVLQTEQGYATVSGNDLLVVAMEYVRQSDGGVYTMYGLEAQRTQDGVEKGSYNLFLNQNSQLIVGNLSSDTSAKVSVTRYDGTVVLNQRAIAIAKNGVTAISIGDFEIPNTYGVVTLEGNGKTAWTIRKRDKDFVIPTNMVHTSDSQIPPAEDLVSGEVSVSECSSSGPGTQNCVWRYAYPKVECANHGCDKLVIFFSGGAMDCGVEGRQSSFYDQMLGDYAADGYVAVCAQLFQDNVEASRYTFADDAPRADDIIKSVAANPAITAAWNGKDLLISGVSHGATAPVIAMARTGDDSKSYWHGARSTGACFYDGIYDANAELAFLQQNQCTDPNDLVNLDKYITRYCGSSTLCSNFATVSAEDTIVSVNPANFTINNWKLISCGSGNLPQWNPCTWDAAVNPPIQELCSDIDADPTHICDYKDLPLPSYNHINCSLNAVNECMGWFDALPR